MSRTRKVDTGLRERDGRNKDYHKTTRRVQKQSIRDLLYEDEDDVSIPSSKSIVCDHDYKSRAKKRGSFKKK